MGGFCICNNLNMKNFVIIALVAVAAGMFFAGRGCLPREAGRVTTRTDTIWVRDTLRDTVLVPIERYVVRVDTVWVPAARDTVRVEVALPVERRIYSTVDYRAVVEGFRPSLVEMEVYRSTASITKETIRSPPPRRWSVGLQAGYGITPRGPAPYLGVGVQYRLAVW